VAGSNVPSREIASVRPPRLISAIGTSSVTRITTPWGNCVCTVSRLDVGVGIDGRAQLGHVDFQAAHPHRRTAQRLLIWGMPGPLSPVI